MPTPRTSPDPTSDRRSRAARACCLAALALAGCRTAPAPHGPGARAALSPAAVRALPIYAGTGGARLTWSDLMDAVGGADVVIIGETHNDAVGHAVQRAVVEDAVERWPGTVLSMEMLERDEQLLVDDYFDGIIDAETFAKLTFSENWGGKGMWSEWYQPIVDAAKDGDGRVVAANAPRRYVRLARTDGYERLDELPSARRRWFDYPDAVPEGAYRDRFFELMSMAHAPPTDDDDAAGAGAEDDAAGLEPEIVEAMFRSQLVWDATMAASIAEASLGGAPKVIHLVGQFHCDFDGGTLLEVRKRLPDARIMVISLQPSRPDALRDEDAGRADLIVYTADPDA